ncbi:MAG TPA: DNA polymerase I [Candidatus Omnitrophota bacterium]|nr:DNA polymerase I [Candidatus Omnitrophota bacterium]
MSTSPRHLYLVDGSGFIFRAFHALPPMTRGDGTPVNAVYGFTNMVVKLLNETDADAIAVIFDASRQTFRSEIYPEYKAHRPPPPEELVPQFPLIRDATRAFNLPCVEQAGFEADDLIATYARQAVARGARVTIVSSDKDLMQLVGDGIEMLDPLKNKAIREAEVFEKFGVAPAKVVDVQALCGDATDNVPGVPGIGVKTAAQLIEEYGDLETLLEKAEGIKQPKRRETLLANAELARISKQLVKLRDDVPVEEPLDSFAVREPRPELLTDFLAQMGFKSILSRLQTKPGAPAPAPLPGTAVAAPLPVAPEYELVLTLDGLKRWVDAAIAAGTVAIDTETTSLDPLSCHLVGVSLCVEPGKACYVPFRHAPLEAQGSLLLGGPDAAPEAPKLVPFAEGLEELRRLCGDPSVLKVGHNLKYDLQVLKACGVDVVSIDDTMLLSYVLDGGAHGHGLDELCKLHFDHTCTTFADVCGSGKAQVTFDKVPLDKARDYAAEDADMALRLHRFLKARLVAERMVTVYETLERPLVPVIVEMERCGIKVDAGVLRSLSTEFGRRMAELEEEVHKLAGHPFNVGSPAQLGKVLFEEMSLPGGKKTKTGQWATGADALEELAAQGHDLPRKVVDWRQVSKLKSTYADALVAQINQGTGRVHTSFSLAATTTGRLSSSDPNLQNIPVRTEDGRKIRHAFIADAGNKILSADYSQIELRLVAHVAKIAGLVEAFRSGMDIHAITASQVFGVPVEGMDPMLRRRAKAINFGIIYGISAFGLAQQLGIPNGEAKAYIDAYFQRYPEIRQYMEDTKETARRQGFVTTLFGRKVFTPGIRDKNGNLRAFAERAAINGPIQGGAADIIKRAMIRLPAELAREGLSARLLLQVHDELVFEVAEAEVDRTAALVKRVMESAASLDVPLVVDTGIGDTWDEAH